MAASTMPVGDDAERALELLEGGGQLVGPDAVDGAWPEAGQAEHGLDRGGVGQVGGRGLQVELGQQVVERLGGGPVDEPGLREVAIGLQPLHRIDGGRAIDPVDGTLVVAHLLQLCLQGRRVRRHLLDSLGLLLVGEAARIVEQPEPGDLERKRSGVVLRRRLRQWSRRRDPLAGLGEIVLGLLDALDRGRWNERGRRRSRGSRRADRHARGSGDRFHQCCLRVGELLPGCGDGGLRLLDLVHRGRHRLARLDEVGAERLDVADGGGIIGEQLAVPVERLEIALCVDAELFTGRLQRFLRIGHARLRLLDPCLGRRHQVLRLTRSRRLRRASIVIVAARRHQEGDGDQRGHGPAPSDGRPRTHAPPQDASMIRHGVELRALRASEPHPALSWSVLLGERTAHRVCNEPLHDRRVGERHRHRLHG